MKKTMKLIQRLLRADQQINDIQWTISQTRHSLEVPLKWEAWADKLEQRCEDTIKCLANTKRTPKEFTHELKFRLKPIEANIKALSSEYPHEITSFDSDS